MSLLIILWVLFFVSHSFFAANSVKAAIQKISGRNFIFYRIVYNLLSVVFLGFILYVLFFKHEMNYLFISSTLLNYTGIGLMIAGIIIMVLAFRNYDLGEFTGIKQLAHQIHHPEKLRITGLNKYVRNPLYTGIIVFILGYFLRQPTFMNLVSLIMIYAYIYIGTLLEEKKLGELFGEEYREYKQQVKMLIPFVF